MVWFAPDPTKCGGRSAVRIINGTRLKFASIIAGYKFPAPVPDVVIITTGFCEVLAIPNAKNPFDLSSIMLWQVNCLFSIKATVNGEFLDPGEIQTCFTPNRANTSAEFFAQVKLETDN